MIEHTVTPPLPGLEALIEAVWDVRVDDAVQARRLQATTPPECAMGLVLCWGEGLKVQSGLGEVQTLRSHVTGLHSAADRLQATGAAGVMTLRFTERGARRFAGGPMRLFAERRTPLADVFTASAVARLEEQLAGCGSAAERSRHAQTEVLRWLHVDAGAGDDALSHAFGRLRDDAGLRIGVLAGELGLSERTLQRRFADCYGMTPKQVALAARLRWVVRLARGRASWTEIAHRCGFSDQPHLIRAFHAAFGQSPQTFRALLADAGAAGSAPADEFNTAIVSLR